MIANDLVSVQPMSLPSGLIFFLDFTSNTPKAGYPKDESLYGGGVVAKGLRDGVSLDGGGNGNLEKGPYSLNNGYASPTGSGNWTKADATLISGIVGSGDFNVDKAVDFDPDLSGSAIVSFPVTLVDNGDNSQADYLNLVAFSGSLPFIHTGGTNEEVGFQIRRLTKLHSGSSGDKYDGTNTSMLLRVVYAATGSLKGTSAGLTELVNAAKAVADTFPLTYPLADEFKAGGAIGSVVGEPKWDLENSVDIPEIDIKVDSIAVTAKTKKLKAKWTPELGQDLNAYHNLDAEVELTSILSEQIALEIDREILEDLIKGATASTQYWSRRPGRFLNRTDGSQIGGNLDNESLMGADFTGTVSEWYETLAETVNDVSAQIHRKTLRGGANFVVCSPEVANILEFTAGFRASIGNDYGNGSIGAVNVGSLSKKFDVYVDPYFPRNVLLVGRKGGSFLESGYVYAPYVPLQVTPTIFGVEDFVPRKGVMTRYAKEMVRPDMYGLVICEDLNG